MLADEVVDRTYSEWLERGGYRRTWDTLDTGVNDAILTWITDGRVSGIPSDSILECEYEVALNNDTAGATLTLQERGLGESDAAAHIAGKKIYVNPRFTRISVLNALKATIRDLYYWGAYRRVIDSSLAIPSVGMITMPAEVTDVLAVFVESLPGVGASAEWVPLQRGRGWEFYPEFSPAKLVVSAGIPGRAPQVVYKANYDFSTWSDVGATDLDDLGVAAHLQEHLPMAVAGYVLRGTEVPKLQEQEIKRLLIGGGEAAQVGANLQVGEMLINTFRSTYVKNEVIALQEKDRPRVAYVGPYS